ncbi:hypothetical protein N9L68_03825 [bacterium]|nr:hypothetical protein [bacterium]
MRRIEEAAGGQQRIEQRGCGGPINIRRGVHPSKQTQMLPLAQRPLPEHHAPLASIGHTSGLKQISI